MVLFFVYPLKFLFVNLVRMFSGRDTRVPAPGGGLHAAIGPGEGVGLMVIYGAGYAAIFALFWLMYRNALRRRGPLGLDPVETLLTRAARRGHLINAAIGVVSILIVLVGGERWSGVAGWTYASVGPLMTVNGLVAGRARRRLAAAGP